MERFTINPKLGFLSLVFITYFLISLWSILSSDKIYSQDDVIAIVKEVSQLKKAKIISRNSSSHPEYIEVVEKTRRKILSTLPKDPSESMLIQKTMEYIHNNSLHLIDDEHARDSLNIIKVLHKLDVASNGNVEEKPHLSCGPRSYVMRALLSRFGIYSRLIQIYSDDYETHEAHRLLEVYNSTTKSWETWDPDYGVTYLDKETRKSADIITMIKSDKSNFIPVGLGREGWVETKTERLKNNFFEAVLFEKNNGRKNPIIMVNEDVFDIEKKFSTGLSFQEYAKKHYANFRLIPL